MLSIARSVFSSFLPLMHEDHRAICHLMKTRGLPKIDENRFIELCKLTINKLKKLSTLIRINSPAIVIGDLHGSIIDLLRIFQIYGLANLFNNCTDPNLISETQRFIFLGDYVDRGQFSVEVIALLFSAFCLFPNNIVLLRGNHEFAAVCSNYGFKDELLDHPANYSPELYKMINDTFAFLSYSAIINDHIFCVHGGISQELKALSDIENFTAQRPIYEYKDNKLIQDLVWSDPSRLGSCEFIPSFTRRHGSIFGSAAVNSFYQNTGMNTIIRGHSYTKKGIEVYFHLNLITVFSSTDAIDDFDCNSTDEKTDGAKMTFNDSDRFCGIVSIDEDSNIYPELLESITKVTRKETHLSIDSSIGLVTRKTLSFPIMNSFSFIQTSTSTSDEPESNHPQELHKTNSSSKRSHHHSHHHYKIHDLAPKNNSNDDDKDEESSTTTSSSSSIIIPKQLPSRRLSISSVYYPSLKNHNDDESILKHSDDDKLKNHDPFDSINLPPKFVHAKPFPRIKAKGSLPNLKFHS